MPNVLVLLPRQMKDRLASADNHQALKRDVHIDLDEIVHGLSISTRKAANSSLLPPVLARHGEREDRLPSAT